MDTYGIFTFYCVMQLVHLIQLPLGMVDDNDYLFIIC